MGLSDSQIRGLPDPAEITQSPAFVGVSSNGAGALDAGSARFEPAETPSKSAAEAKSRRPRRALLRPSPSLPLSARSLLAALEPGLFRHHLSCRDLLHAFSLGPGWLVLGWGCSGLEGALLSKLASLRWRLFRTRPGRSRGGAVEQRLFAGSVRLALELDFFYSCATSGAKQGLPERLARVEGQPAGTPGGRESLAGLGATVRPTGRCKEPQHDH